MEHSVRRGSRAIELTPKEYSLLEFLMRNAGQRVTRSQIIEHVWNLSHDTMTNVVDVYINYSSAQVDKRRVGQLAIAIQVAFQQMGVFDASNTRPAVANSEPMPFSNVQMVENQERVQSMGRLVNAPRGALGESPDRADLNEIQRQLQTALAGADRKAHRLGDPDERGDCGEPAGSGVFRQRLGIVAARSGANPGGLSESNRAEADSGANRRTHG